jgi:hypothetical protein
MGSSTNPMLKCKNQGVFYSSLSTNISNNNNNNFDQWTHGVQLFNHTHTQCDN